MSRGKHTVNGDRWAVVTGASSGIGFAMARRLAMRGYGIFAVSKDAERLEESAGRIADECGVRVIAHAMDLARPDAAEALFGEYRKAGIRAEVLVNDAGVFIYNDIMVTAQLRIAYILSLHMRTVTALCRLFALFCAAVGC